MCKTLPSSIAALCKRNFSAPKSCKKRDSHKDLLESMSGQPCIGIFIRIGFSRSRMITFCERRSFTASICNNFRASKYLDWVTYNRLIDLSLGWSSRIVFQYHFLLLWTRTSAMEPIWRTSSSWRLSPFSASRTPKQPRVRAFWTNKIFNHVCGENKLRVLTNTNCSPAACSSASWTILFALRNSTLASSLVDKVCRIEVKENSFEQTFKITVSIWQ